MDFRSKILNIQLDKKKIPVDSVLTELKQLFQNFDEETFETAFEPIILKDSLPEPFKSSFEQQDALEFGRIFLEIIEKLLIDAGMKVLFLSISIRKLFIFKNMVEDLFFGECVNTFFCVDCGNSTKMLEKILDLSVNFSNKKHLFLIN